MALNISSFELGTLGTELGSLLTNLAGPLGTFMITLVIIGGIAGIITAIIVVIKNAVKSRK